MCALPLSKVLPQRRTNSLDAERENFERSQSVSISKAISCQETPVKEKHVRSAIIGTFSEKGAGTFWHVVLKLPLQGNPIVCWKFCHVLHKIIREGHNNAISDSQKYRTTLVDLGKLWGLLKDGYGCLIQCYCNLLVAKLDFHKRNARFPGSLAVTDDELDDIGERDVNVFFQLSCEFFDYMDEILALEAAVFGSLDMSRSNSMTSCGQCRLAPLIPCIQDSSQLYDYTVKVLFKLHSALPPDTLTGHRERFLKQFKSLQQFYISASNLQYFKTLIQVPLLPEKPPNFLVASDLSCHVSPVVILPPQTDTPENETVDMSLVDTSLPKPCPSPDVLEGAFRHDQVDFHYSNGTSSPDHLSEKDQITDQLQKRIETLKMEIQRIKIEYERKIDDFKRQMVNLEHIISERDKTIQCLQDENEDLKSQLSAEPDLSTKLTEAEKKAKVQEEKFHKMKEVYNKLREEHISLIRNKAEVDKQLGVFKTVVETVQTEKQDLLRKIQESSNGLVIENEQFQQSELTTLSEEKQELERVKLQLEENLEHLREKNSQIGERLELLNESKDSVENKLLEIEALCASLNGKLVHKDSKRDSYLECALAEAQHIVQVAIDDFDSSVLPAISCTSEYFLRQLEDLLTTSGQFKKAYVKFSNADDEIEDMFRLVSPFSHLLANVLLEGKAVSQSSADIEQGDELAICCKNIGTGGIQLLEKMRSKAPEEEILGMFNIQKNDIDAAMSLMEALVLNMSQDQSQKLADMVEEELKQMVQEIDLAAQKIQELLNRSKADDSGMKLEVNSKILDSCTSLMQAIKVLVHASKNLQEEIVSQGKGSCSEKEFYNRNHRWTEGLISAAKVVGIGAKFLVDAADKVISGQTKFEELMVASQEIAAATAQLVIASRVKAERGSVKFTKLSQASKAVTEATGKVVATAKSCAEMVEESEVMDFSTLTLHQAKRLEVESQVRVLELESSLVKERVRLAGLRKQHYQLAGASEGWEEGNQNAENEGAEGYYPI